MNILMWLPVWDGIEPGMSQARSLRLALCPRPASDPCDHQAENALDRPRACAAWYFSRRHTPHCTARARTGKQILSMLLPKTLSMKAGGKVCCMATTPF